MTAEQEDERIAACQDLTETADSDLDFFNEIVTGDESLMLCLQPSDETRFIDKCWRKFSAATKSSVPEVCREERVGDFLRLTRSHAQKILTGMT